MLKEDMLHYSYMNISQFLKKFDFYSSFEAGFMLEQECRSIPSITCVIFCSDLLPASSGVILSKVVSGMEYQDSLRLLRRA